MDETLVQRLRTDAALCKHYFYVDIASSLTEAAAEIERLAGDARRYRGLVEWLQEQLLLRIEHCQIDKPETLGDWWVMRKPYMIGPFVSYGKTEDAAIDAAISQDPGSTVPKEDER